MVTSKAGWNVRPDYTPIDQQSSIDALFSDNNNNNNNNNNRLVGSSVTGWNVHRSL